MKLIAADLPTSSKLKKSSKTIHGLYRNMSERNKEAIQTKILYINKWLLINHYLTHDVY